MKRNVPQGMKTRRTHAVVMLTVALDAMFPISTKRFGSVESSTVPVLAASVPAT